MEERRQNLAEIVQNPKHLARDCVLIFIFGLILFTVGHHHQEFINFESRFALFAQNMLKTGPTLFPTIFGIPYPDYPGTSTFIIYLFSLPAGEVTKLSATLPTAIVSSLSLMFVYLTVSPHSRKWGFCSVLFMLFTVIFFTSSRSLTMDPYTVLASTFVFYALYSRETQRTKKPLYWIPIALILAFLVRGPIGLVIPAGIACGFYAVSERWKRLVIFAISALVLLILLSLLLLLCANLVGGHHFIERVIGMEVGGRFAPFDTEPFLFYFAHSWGNYALSFPFAFVVMIAFLPKLFDRNPNKHIRLLQYSIIATLIIIIGMSIPGGKKSRYILAMTPFLSIVAAYLFVAIKQPIWLRAFRHCFTFLFFFFPFICATVTLLARNYAYHKGLHLNDAVHYNALFILLAIIQIIALIYALTLSNYSKKEVIALTVATITFAIINIMVVEPVKQQLNSARPFVHDTENLRAANPGPLYFYKTDPDGDAIKYFVNTDLKHPPHYINTEAALMQTPNNAYVIIEGDDYQDLSEKAQNAFDTLYAGNFGRDEDLVIQKAK